MMPPRPYRQVDVFTAQACMGNPVGVVMDASGWDTAMMQRFTDWTNLSECTFVLPPTPQGQESGADYQVRIFCPGRELPFAGHPTLGTCHAWLEMGGQPRAADVVQECGVGLVRVRRQNGRLAFAAPPLRRQGPLSEQDLARLVHGLGLQPHEVIAHSWCDNGPAWRGLLLQDANRVRKVQPDPIALKDWEVGLIAPQDADGDTAFEVRAFFPGHGGLAEDPVTGSLNAAMAQWLISTGRAPQRYTAAQGSCMGRAGRVYIEQDATQTVWVGGDTVTCIRGHVPW